MAFGDVKDTDSVGPSSTASSNAISLIGGSTANVGDLVYALFVEETTLTVTAVTDNLGNTYTALNAGTDAGAVTARAFYSRVTNSGVLTTVTFAATSSGDDHVRIAVLFEGPISAIDKNLANITSDIASPFSCPPTGTLTQADEIVVAWGAANYATAWSSTSPMITCKDQATSPNLKGIIASKVVAATTTTTPTFTAGSNPTQAILATSTFKKAPTEIITVTQATVTLTGKTVTLLNIDIVTVAKATVTLTGKTVTVRDTGVIPVTNATVTVTGKTVNVVNAVNDFVTVAPAAVVVTGKAVSVGDISSGIVGVGAGSIAYVGKTVTVSGADVVAVGQAVVALTGKPVTIREANTILVNKATVTFTGRAITIDTWTFQDVPKYTIRGRGSRYGLWTQGNGGTIKGRGSRAFLVMQ